MRLTNNLLKQHNGWLQKIKWKIQGKRTILDTGCSMDLQKRGIVVNDGLKYLNHLHKLRLLNVNLPLTPIVKKTLDPATETKSFIFGNTNVLVYGIPQAQVLTNSATFNGFPQEIESKIQSIKLPTNVERSMHQSVLVSHLLDAEQVKSYEVKSLFAHKNLFKHKVPREYGITDTRKNMLFASRLINHCERYYGLGAKHRVLEDLQFSLPITIGEKNVQFNVNAEFLISSLRPINALNTSNLDEPSFVKIDPLEPAISIPRSAEGARSELRYPIKSSTLHPHTALLDFSRSYVKNLYEEPVNDSQFESRALLKAFVITSAWAKKFSGGNSQKLDQPVVLQVVQFDKQRVQFGIFQLNTLDMEGDVKNYWFRKPIINLYDECKYDDGRPQLVNYNFNVFKTLCVLYGH